MNKDRFKFRAWDGERMYTPSSVDSEGNACVAVSYEPDCATDDTLMQSTGLRDKNGQLIYEGDIIEINTNTLVPFTAKVYYNENKLIWCAKMNHEKAYELFLWDVGEVKILGNIYENPELLEQDQ